MGPLPATVAWPAVARCLGISLVMLARGHVRLPREHVGRQIRFADGTAARVYRDTAVARTAADPCVLVVAFRLRGVRGRGHALFRAESLLNTPLFVGFPGFVSKLWLAADERGVYRGLYEWDGPAAAEHYARSLWRVLRLVCEEQSIDFRVLPHLHRDDFVSGAARPGGDGQADDRAWWRVRTP